MQTYATLQDARNSLTVHNPLSSMPQAYAGDPADLQLVQSILKVELVDGDTVYIRSRATAEYMRRNFAEIGPALGIADIISEHHPIDLDADAEQVDTDKAVYVIGETYANRDALRALGLTWDAGHNAWTGTLGQVRGKLPAGCWAVDQATAALASMDSAGSAY